MDEVEMQEILVDFGKICRLCLTEDEGLVDLHSSDSLINKGSNTAAEKILQLMSIKIDNEDGLPSYVCHNCLSQVDNCCEFVEMCHNSQMTLIQSYVRALSQAGVSPLVIKQFLAERDIDFCPEPIIENNSVEVSITKERPKPPLLKTNQDFKIEPKNEKFIKVEKSPPQNEEYYCSDCSKIFTNKDELTIHRISVHHDDLVTETLKVDQSSNKITGLWTCDTCGAKFRSKSAITTHIRCQHLKQEKEPTSYFRRLIFCKYCGSSFSRANFTRHMEVIHRQAKNLDFDQTDIGSFDCQICFRPFMRHSSLRNHLEKYHSENLQLIAEQENCDIVWSCGECDSLFTEEVYLIQHYGSKHSKYPLEVDSHRVLKQKNLICSCGVVNANSLEVTIHDIFYHYDDMEEREESLKLECVACEKTFKKMIDLKKHLISYHWFVALSHDNECIFCGLEFNTNDMLRVHLHEKHGISFEKIPVEEKIEKPKKLKKDEEKIELNEKNLELKDETSNDLKVEAITQIFVCDNCNIYFDTEELLRNHSQECRSSHVCVLCDKSYKSELHLKRHVVEYHDTMAPIKCPLCPKVFPRKMNLHNHYKRRHLKQAKKFVCSYCGLSLKGKVALRSHEDRLHRNIRSYKCSECPEAFTTRSILRKHAQRHLAERPMLQCHYCDRKFSTISGIERHVKTHEGVKEFVCDVPQCEKAFYTKSELKRHIKFHNKDFRHVCTICNHKFMSPGELKKHTTKHTGERPFKCHLCPSAYSRRDDKVKHLKKVHNLKVKRVYGKPLRRNSDDENELVDTIVIDDEEMTVQEDIVYADGIAELQVKFE